MRNYILMYIRTNENIFKYIQNLNPNHLADDIVSILDVHITLKKYNQIMFILNIFQESI